MKNNLKVGKRRLFKNTYYDYEAQVAKCLATEAKLCRSITNELNTTSAVS